jgi:hypothetical protein
MKEEEEFNREWRRMDANFEEENEAARKLAPESPCLD